MNQLLYEKYQRYHAKRAALWALDSPTDRIYRRMLDDRLYVPRYMEHSSKPSGVFRRTDGLDGIEGDPKHVGLRLVGCVVPYDSRRGYYNGRGPFMEPNDIGKVGWVTNLDGDVFKDGEGLVWGAVFQLPTRNFVHRFVAGYNIGGDDYIAVDLSCIYTSRSTYQTVKEERAALEAAKAADHMAEQYAEEEREWQETQREENDGWD